MIRLIILLSLLAVIGMNGEKTGKLTLKQVVALVAAAPDQVAANEIRQRGMADSVSNTDVVRVQKAGGGPLTLEALRRLIITPVLIIGSNQEQSEVLVDGARQGICGPTNKLTLRDVDPGAHIVTVRKLRYSSTELPVTLTSGKTQKIDATLELAVASLSIVTNAPNPQVEIEGIDLAGRSPANLELPPGSYVIHVNAPRFAAATETVTLKAGETRRLEVPLTIDPSFTRSLIDQAKREQTAGHYAVAFKLAGSALAIEPTNGQALAVEAMASFYGEQYQNFVQIGFRALQAGGELDIPVIHRHALKAAHFASLNLGSNTISYDPEIQSGANCNLAAFQVPISDLQSVDLKQDSRAQRYLEIRLAGSGLAKPQTLVFADYRARVQAQGNGLGFLIAPPSGADEITHTASLLQLVLRSFHP